MFEKEIPNDGQLTEEQKRELDKRYADYQNGIGKTFTWEEAVEITKQALKRQKD